MIVGPDRSWVLCTNNPGKLAEMRALLPPDIPVKTLGEVGIFGDLPETGATLEANALQKARYVHARDHRVCLADDTGLEVDALLGAPGVVSARYAGPDRDAAANMEKLLRSMRNATDRKARFRTVFALIEGGREHLFQGVVEGTIALGPRGVHGFGYDPVFIPDGHVLTFAEMAGSDKNAISHRAAAMRALARFLREHHPTR